MTQNPKMSRNLETLPGIESPLCDIMGGMKEVSVCCSYDVAHISDTKDDKIFCMNCGQPCSIKSPSKLKQYGTRLSRNSLSVRTNSK